MVREFPPAPIRPRRLRGARLATAILLVVTLAGCGVKGPLRLPSAAPAATTGAPATDASAGTPDATRKP
jgi:predicted small lipoprotein YifL